MFSLTDYSHPYYLPESKAVTIQIHKRFQITLFIRTEHNMRIFGVIPFIKIQNDTLQSDVKTMKM